MNSKKKWYVYFSCRNPKNGRMVRFRLFKGFTQLKTREKRIEYGKKVVVEVAQKLINGWTPFEKESGVIYNDSLAYQNVKNNYEFQRKNNRSFNYLINLYLETLVGIRPSTLATYKSKFRYFQAFLVKGKIEGNDFVCFRNADAVKFQQYLKEERKLSNKSLNAYTILMKAFFNYLTSNFGLKINAFEGFRRLPVETKRPKVFTPEILHRFMDVARRVDPQMGLVFQLIYNCFVRPKELRFLKIENIDFARSKIKVPASIAKDKQERVVDVPDYLLQKMKDLGFNSLPDSLFITSIDGKPGIKPVSKNFFYIRFIRIKKIAQIPRGYILYAFKHTGMVDLKLSGADWLDIKNQAGHESLDQTIEYTKALMAEGSKHIREKAPRI